MIVKYQRSSFSETQGSGDSSGGKSYNMHNSSNNPHQTTVMQHNFFPIGVMLISLFLSLYQSIHYFRNVLCNRNLFGDNVAFNTRRNNFTKNQNRFIRSYYRPRRPPLRPIWSLSQRPQRHCIHHAVKIYAGKNRRMQDGRSEANACNWELQFDFLLPY